MSSTKKETEEKDASRESCDKRKDTKSKSTPKDSLQQRRKGKEPYLSDKMTKTQRVAECRPPTGRSLPPSFDFSDENAMKWGGFDKKKTGISLSNTCTIDNILTALYIIVCSRPDVLQKLKKCTDTATQVVLEICLNEMVQRKWTEAKVKFVQDLLKKRESKVDLFGTEFEMAVKHLVRPQRHTSEIYCVECFASRSTQHELIELGIGESRQNSIHELLFQWAQGSESRCPARCGGVTSTYQRFDSLPAILFIAVDIASAAGRLKTDTLVDPIFVVGKQFDLYAATLNKNGHFRMLVRSNVDGPWYSYDGFRNSD